MNQKYLEQDVNSWDRIEAGRPQAAWGLANGYASYRANVTLPKSVHSVGGNAVFEEIVGTAEIHVNGSPVARKTDPRGGSITVALPTATASATITVILHADAAPAGLTGRVEVVPKQP